MTRFEVTVTIGNKPGLSDPEGQTILKDLVLKGKELAQLDSKKETVESFDNTSPHTRISAIRTAKVLRFTMDSASSDTAKSEVSAICDELHIYNPLVSVVDVAVSLVKNN